ncbi:DEAD/DEAH box helicase [Nitrincola schmidtii]|uniref:DEAD/DEAH box helicase n=1 Tax=Nitrincola schmidtii TaxID=1730894 RepID=UPI00124E858C|nr:DEAD/DEAH box helicase [Nitrincola schmidtii]
MTLFSSLGLCPELQFTLDQLGYAEATPIQAQTIPLILRGDDLVAQAQTGTGKTASFALPMIEKLKHRETKDGYHEIRGLVLTPTRELAIQVGDKMLDYGTQLGMRVISIYGGVRFDNQLRKMKRGADILVATPGRLLDMLLQKKLSLSQLEILVLDEADRMLDLGFADELRQLLQYIPTKRQTLLFSATYDPNIQLLVDKMLVSPSRVSTTPNKPSASGVTQRAFAVDNADKADILSYLIRECHWSQTLVFTRTKKRADQVNEYLNSEGISSVALHGDKAQRERNDALLRFSQKEVRVLVATDVAARGLDIESLPQVINYDLPNQPEAYVHRIGRTGRAGKKGLAISFVSTEEKRFLQDITQLIRQEILIEAVPIIEDGRLPTDRKKISTQKASPSKKRSFSNNQKQGSAEVKKPKAESPAAKDKAGRRSLFG